VAVLTGHRRPWHGVEVVADAWRRMGSRAPHLLVLGDGEGTDALAVAGAEMRPHVPEADLPGILAAADIALLPYTADAPAYLCPLKLFEFLAAGLAVVATDMPAIAAVVDETTACVVPPGSPRALATTVRALADDPAARFRLGLAGRRLVSERHTWRHRAREVLEIAAVRQPLVA
jgi:glycosyltransferase involved in cell wall biosynthesis